MASLTVAPNRKRTNNFFSSVRELSVSSERGDGNEEPVKMPMVRP